MNRKKKKIELFDIVVNTIIIILTIMIIYPLYFTVIASFSDPVQVSAGHTLLWIKGFTVEAYQNIIKNKEIWIGYRNTIVYTLLGTLYNLALTIPAAYVLSKKTLPFRGVISWYFFITMYISGGMIPSYLLMRDLNLINNPLVMIIGAGVSCYNLIITRQYFSDSIPGELFESAAIDGASDWYSFKKIALPLAKPIVAVMSLYYGVGHWNSYYTGLIYIYKEEYFSLQQMLRKILMLNQTLSIDSEMDGDTILYMLHKFQVAQGMKYAVIFVACLPLLMIYPFLQKYFAKGVMIGSVKG